MSALTYEQTIRAHQLTGLKGILYNVVSAGTGRDLSPEYRNLSFEQIAKLFPYKRPRLNNRAKGVIKNLRPKGVSLFLDSAAFPMKQKICYISIDEYIDFIRLYGKQFDVVVGLDVIGDTAKSIENYKYMISNGADHDKFIMTWHITQPRELLEKVMSMTDYIGIGGNAKMPLWQKIRAVRRALDFTWSRDRKIKVHVFGTGNPYVMRYYSQKAYSVDSSTWNMASRYGFLFSLSGQKALRYHGKLPRDKAGREVIDFYNTFKMVDTALN